MIKPFLRLLRLVFVIFSLYLLGDAFYRWDAFRYYASFSEFIPSIALASMLWSIIALLATLLIWLSFHAIKWLCLLVNCKLRLENFIIFSIFSTLIIFTFWIGKRQVFPSAQTTSQMKLAALLVAAIISIVGAWLLRNKSESWMNFIHERITPLVYIFSILISFSVPFVIYHSISVHKTDRAEVGKPIRKSFAKKDTPNIIYVTFDALSKKDMSLYGYERITTPFISDWAKSATVFTNLKADSNFTAPATASMMTGKRVWTHQRYHSHGSQPVAGGTENFPLLLKNTGYYNMAFVVNSIASVDELGMSESFDFAPPAYEFRVPTSPLGLFQQYLQRLFSGRIRLYDWILQRDFVLYKVIPAIFKESRETEWPVEKVLDRFFRVIDNEPPEPYFAWIHLYPPHSHYLPPVPFMGMFDFSNEFRTYESQDSLVSLIQRAQPENDVYRARYNEFIRYCDKQFEYFINHLEAKKMLGNTVVILSSDHGEIFEHNFINHGNSLYEAETDIPLIIRIPNQNIGRVINDLVEQIDIPATILDVADIPAPSWVEGRSLVPLLNGETLPYRPVFSMNLQLNPSLGHKITKGMFAVWKGSYKLIYDLGENKTLLFNLEQDPDELNNLMYSEYDIGKYLRNLTIENLKNANQKYQLP
jgi:arylsulfatase A-like enzyme